MIPLWRDKPVINSNFSSTNNELIKKIFSSARQLITISLIEFGLSRKDRVAIPEWSSHCVISSVGKISMPIPLNEVTSKNLKVDALLLYEQWGWPISTDAKTFVREKFNGCKVIYDRVDSADVENKSRVQFYPENQQAEIISLSKILGLPGGGQAKLNGSYLTNDRMNETDYLNDIIWKKNHDNQYYSTLINLHKNNIASLHPELNLWLSKNDLKEAINIESLERRKNLLSIINTELAEDWPEWMFEAYKNGAAPGIIPIARSREDSELSQFKKQLRMELNIETEVYNFNWTGNPFISEYQKVLAIPIHGMATSIMNQIIELTIYLLNK